MLESNNFGFTTEKVKGAFEDEISFDYEVNNLCIKYFSFKGKNLRRLIGSARQWAFAASEVSPEKKGSIYI